MNDYTKHVLNSLYDTDRMYKEYCDSDTVITNSMASFINNKPIKQPGIKNVIFNPPATIIIWDDYTKTVVKCGENDIYDPEKGMAMAICKKVFGNKGNYCNIFKKWLPNEEVKNCFNCKHSDKSMFESPFLNFKKLLHISGYSNWETETFKTKSEEKK